MRFQESNKILKLYNTNNRLNVTESRTTLRTQTKQTKNTSKVIDLRGRLKTADHCRAICEAGGKPSTWFPPGGLVEQSTGRQIKRKRRVGRQSPAGRRSSVVGRSVVSRWSSIIGHELSDGSSSIISR